MGVSFDEVWRDCTTSAWTNESCIRIRNAGDALLSGPHQKALLNTHTSFHGTKKSLKHDTEFVGTAVCLAKSSRCRARKKLGGFSSKSKAFWGRSIGINPHIEAFTGHRLLLVGGSLPTLFDTQARFAQSFGGGKIVGLSQIDRMIEF